MYILLNKQLGVDGAECLCLLMILDDCEMLKALYDFDATLAKTLGFSANEFFYLQQNNTKQRNWWHVVNRKGQVGFVPSNYVAAVKVNTTNMNLSPN